MSRFSRFIGRATRKCSHYNTAPVPFVDEPPRHVGDWTWITTTQQWQCVDCSAIVAIDIYQRGYLHSGSELLRTTWKIHLGLTTKGDTLGS